jgi:hypothetical protein
MQADDLPEPTRVALEKYIAIAHKQTHAPVENIRRMISSMLPMLKAESVSALPPRDAALMLVHGAMQLLGGIEQ